MPGGAVAGHLVSAGARRPDHPRHAARSEPAADRGGVCGRSGVPVRAAARYPAPPAAAPARASGAGAGGRRMSGIAAVYRRELVRIFTVPPAFAVLVLSLFVYAALYPQPYLTEALRDVPVAVVDR